MRKVHIDKKNYIDIQVPTFELQAWIQLFPDKGLTENAARRKYERVLCEIGRVSGGLSAREKHGELARILTEVFAKSLLDFRIVSATAAYTSASRH